MSEPREYYTQNSSGWPYSAHRINVRSVLTIYLVLYYLLVAGAAVTVWRSGLIAHLPRGWTLAAFALAIALGVILFLTSRK
jgi:hypothetical protein